MGYWAEPEIWVWFGRIRDLDHVDSYIRRGIQREGSTCVRMYVVWPDLLKIPPVSNPVVLSFIFKKILVTSNYLVCVVVVVCLFVCLFLSLACFRIHVLQMTGDFSRSGGLQAGIEYITVRYSHSHYTCVYACLFSWGCGK